MCTLCSDALFTAGSLAMTISRHKHLLLTPHKQNKRLELRQDISSCNSVRLAYSCSLLCQTLTMAPGDEYPAVVNLWFVREVTSLVTKFDYAYVFSISF